MCLLYSSGSLVLSSQAAAVQARLRRAWTCGRAAAHAWSLQTPLTLALTFSPHGMSSSPTSLWTLSGLSYSRMPQQDAYTMQLLEWA